MNCTTLIVIVETMEPHLRPRYRLAMHHAAANKLRQHPELLGKIKDNLEKARARALPDQLAVVKEWEKIIDHGQDVFIAAAVEEGQHADDRRAVGLISGILTTAERMQLIRRLRDGDAQ